MECVDLDYLTPREIAEQCGYPVRTVRAGIQRARGLKLDLATVWEIEWRSTPNVFGQATQCELHDFTDIPKGLAIGCLACLKTGLDYLIRRPTTREKEHGNVVPPKQEPPKDFAERHHRKDKH
jgi:hypothetical protein